MKNQLNIPYTKEKIKLTKEIMPCLPKDILPAINKSLVITEKIIILYEAIDLIEFMENNYLEEVIPINNSKDKLEYVTEVIQNNFSNKEFEKLNKILDIFKLID